MSARGRGPDLHEFNAGGQVLGKLTPSLQGEAPDSGANLELEPEPAKLVLKRELKEYGEMLPRIPEWNLQKAVEITCFLMFITFVVHGIGELFGFFQDECDRPHMIIKDEDKSR